MLRACRDAAVGWFEDNPAVDAARSVIHGDFTPWNLLFDNGRPTGVLEDLLAAHYGDTQPVNAPPKLGWQIAHLRKHSALLEHKAGAPRLSLGK
jgi:hypothetical protein